MDANTLSAAMGGAVSAARYEALLPAVTECLTRCGCTTIQRAAMWLAQVGHESLGLRYMQEIWGPTAAQRGYEGRRDLGNTQPGDGRRFAGHGPLQVTGRHNHTQVSVWAHSKGYVPTATYFVDHPDELASDRYGFVGVTWYWTVARPTLNAKADAGDVEGATRLVNGGTNGLADRRARYQRALSLGARILPSGCDPAPTGGADTLPSLERGDAGPAVAALQRFLNAYGWRPALPLLPTDGHYGPRTTEVVRAAQAQMGITGPDADGTVIGPRTNAALWQRGYRG